MSLRDDLEQLFTCTGRDTRYTEEWQEPYLRLRAALTPAALVWLEALPGVMELNSKATPGPWANDGVWPEDDKHQTTGIAWEFGMVGETYNQDLKLDFNAKENCDLIVALRNALHAAAKAQECGDKENNHE